MILFQGSFRRERLSLSPLPARPPPPPLQRPPLAPPAAHWSRYLCRVSGSGRAQHFFSAPCERRACHRAGTGTSPLTSRGHRLSGGPTQSREERQDRTSECEDALLCRRPPGEERRTKLKRKSQSMYWGLIKGEEHLKIKEWLKSKYYFKFNVLSEGQRVSVFLLWSLEFYSVHFFHEDDFMSY